jgi:hypothetical protein
VYCFQLYGNAMAKCCRLYYYLPDRQFFDGAKRPAREKKADLSLAKRTIATPTSHPGASGGNEVSTFPPSDFAIVNPPKAPHLCCLELTMNAPTTF